MGYTHYWKNREFTAAEWQALSDAARKLLDAPATPGAPASRNVAGWDGKGDPEISAERISFNGIGEDSFETCSITRAADSFVFCKTGRRPYDIFVVAMLVLASKTGALTWSSDGEDGDHEAGRRLAEEIPFTG